MAVEYIGQGGPDGTSVGSSATEKVSVYGVTPVVQAATLTAVTTTASTTTTPYGYTSTQADAIVTAVNAIIVALENFGICASA